MTSAARSADEPVAHLLGVYNADGGVRGEISYIVGHMLGTRECALCDITHTWRRKPEWDAMTRRLRVRFDLRHLNELDEAQRRAVAQTGAPAVFVVTGETLTPIMDAAALATAAGDVRTLERALCDAIPALICTGARTPL